MILLISGLATAVWLVQIICNRQDVRTFCTSASVSVGQYIGNGSKVCVVNVGLDVDMGFHMHTLFSNNNQVNSRSFPMELWSAQSRCQTNIFGERYTMLLPFMSDVDFRSKKVMVAAQRAFDMALIHGLGLTFCLCDFSQTL